MPDETGERAADVVMRLAQSSCESGYLIFSVMAPKAWNPLTVDAEENLECVEVDAEAKEDKEPRLSDGPCLVEYICVDSISESLW